MTSRRGKGEVSREEKEKYCTGQGSMAEMVPSAACGYAVDLTDLRSKARNSTECCGFNRETRDIAAQ
jgi:hypothetical protein